MRLRCSVSLAVPGIYEYIWLDILLQDVLYFAGLWWNNNWLHMRTGLIRALHFGGRKATGAFHCGDIPEALSYVCRCVILRTELHSTKIAVSYKSINLKLEYILHFFFSFIRTFCTLNKLGGGVGRKKQRWQRVVHSPATTVMAGCVNAKFAVVLSSECWSLEGHSSNYSRIGYFHCVTPFCIQLNGDFAFSDEWLSCAQDLIVWMETCSGMDIARFGCIVIIYTHGAETLQERWKSNETASGFI
jgi:hypothetical protein